MTEPARRAYKRAWKKANPEKVRASSRAWYKANPEKVLANRRARQQWLNELKSKPCMDCGGIFPPCAMQFHHRDATQKKFDVSGGLNRSQISVLAEIAKCDLLCANCHAIRTYKGGSDNE